MIRLEDILAKVEKHHPGDNLDLIRRAYIFSAKEHKGQVRASGEPYLTHPLEVANILAEMKMDAVTVSVGLLHDVVEDTLVSLEDDRRTLRPGSRAHRRRRHQDQPDPVHLQGRKTGRELPQNASRHDRRYSRHHGEVRRPPAQHANARISFRPTAVKPSPARPWRSMRPLANRLGMGKIRGELEDLAFSYLDPKAYQELKEIVERKRKAHEAFLAEVTQIVEAKMKEHDIPCFTESRIKRLYSIHHEAQEAAHHDRSGLRSAGAAHHHGQREELLRRSRRDSQHVAAGARAGSRISSPCRGPTCISRCTLRSLQAASPSRCRFELRKCIALLKKASPLTGNTKTASSSPTTARIERISWLRHLVEWQQEMKDPADFLSTLKIDLYPEEVYTFTPKGKVITLPRDATPVDFAYAIHTEVGHTCVGAKINGRMVPLKTKLKNGDIVEIVTQPGHKPSRDWLSFVKTSRARNKIRHWLTEQESEKAIELGRKMLEKEARKFKTELRRTCLKAKSCRPFCRTTAPARSRTCCPRSATERFRRSRSLSRLVSGRTEASPREEESRITSRRQAGSWPRRRTPNSR